MSDRSARRLPPLWLAVVFSALACVVAISGSLTRPVWHDELYTLALARMPIRGLFAALRLDSGPPLHYLICHTLFSIVRWPEGSALGTFMVRLPSALAYSLMPWVLWKWSRGQVERYFWAALLTMVWLPMLYFATEARAYALLALVNAVLWLLGPDLVRSGGRRLVLFAALAAALPMLHYAGIVSFCFLPALALFIPRSRWRSFAAALGAAVLPLLIWSPIILGSPNDSMRWVNIADGPGRPGIASIEVLSPAGPYPALFETDASPVPTTLSGTVLMVMFVALLLGAVRILQKRHQVWEQFPTVVRLAIGLLPVVTLGGLAIIGLPVYFAGRTESMVWPLAAGLAGVSLAALRPGIRLAAAVPYALIATVTVGLWIGSLSSRRDAPGVEVGRQLAGVMISGDRVVVVGPWQLEIVHGLAGKVAGAVGDTLPVELVETLPRSQSEHPGWFDMEAAISPDLVSEAANLGLRIAVSNGRLWLVWSPSLPVEQNVLPAFLGWIRSSVVDSQIIAVDLLTPPKPREDSAVRHPP